ncbi:MAG TPA: periplasmic heavy metal sensor [Stellaceae bacterium]|nr:periplasmic heavy metal sensor [Stellaceae bacterium]
MTAITAAVRRPPRHYLTRMVLALSLALNLCFVGGAVWTRMRPPPHPDIARRLHQIEAKLALDPQQRQAFGRYTATIEDRLRMMRRQAGPLFGEAWAEMANPQTKPADVMRIFDRARAERRSFEQDLTTATLAFLARLSPAQRQKFVMLIHPRAARRLPAAHRPNEHGS